MKCLIFAIAVLFICEAWVFGQAGTVRRAGTEADPEDTRPDPLLASTGTGNSIDSGILFDNNVPTDSVDSTDTDAPHNQALSMDTVTPGSGEATNTDETFVDTTILIGIGDPIDESDTGLSPPVNIPGKPGTDLAVVPGSNSDLGVNPDKLPLHGMEKVTQQEIDILAKAGEAVVQGKLEYICVMVKNGHYVLNKQSKSAQWDDFAKDLYASGPGYALHWSFLGDLYGIINGLNGEELTGQEIRLLGSNSINFFAKIHALPPMHNIMPVLPGTGLNQLQEALFEN